jgi:hypothetical protein
MAADALEDTVTAAVASIEGVASHIETAFSQVGGHLGRGHTIFLELNDGLASLSQEFSGAGIEGASAELRDIALKLNRLAEALPFESALLGGIGENAAQASSLLKVLVKHIQMITIVARSARIEAASFDGDQGHFLDFTQEAFELAKTVQISIKGCTHDQELLSEAIETALRKQKEFENRHRAQLLSVSADLTSACSSILEQRDKGVRLADLTTVSTKKIAEAVGTSIVSLQVGDSTRQRLEHICHGLRVAAGSEASLVPAMTNIDHAAPLICQLQAGQLKDAVVEFDNDIGQIGHSLNTLFRDATGVVGHGRSLYVSQDGTTSFLAVMKQTLAQAAGLIGTCESARKTVDEALSVLEGTLGKFRHAISELSETVVDIILIGMNASLKAGHLGTRGSAFVVIANELKATADRISDGAGLLKPVLDSIERSAAELRKLRVDEDPSKLAALEPSVLHAIQEIEAGNDRLGQLIELLGREGAEFESSMTAAQAVLTALGEASARLPSVATRLEAVGARTELMSSIHSREVEQLFDELAAQYTMESERDVHARFSQRCGLTYTVAAHRSEQDQSDDVLFF